MFSGISDYSRMEERQSEKNDSKNSWTTISTRVQGLIAVAMSSLGIAQFKNREVLNDDTTLEMKASGNLESNADYQQMDPQPQDQSLLAAVSAWDTLSTQANGKQIILSYNTNDCQKRELILIKHMSQCVIH